MPAWQALSIVGGGVIAMEALAALVHRFWMHGPGWAWHRSHHVPAVPCDQPTVAGKRQDLTPHRFAAHRFAFERNDRFAIVFATLSLAAMIAGRNGVPWLFWAGIGMAVYGVLYALVHDGLVHRRFPWPWPPPRRGYLARLVQAHRLHHAVHEREGAVSFGFLYAAPPRRLAARLRARRAAPRASGHAVRSSVIGLALAATIAFAWAALLGFGLFVNDPIGGGVRPWATTIVTVTLLCWLDVGLFIVAHDAMHRTLAPAWPRVNRAVGRLALLLYAGFGFDRFANRHHQHHRTPGGDDDPDFHRDPRFWRWYGAFLRRYVDARQLGGLVLTALLLSLIASPTRVIVFWLLPALLASLQLFAFGTWLPHRPRAGEAFVDRHRARSNRYGRLASLLTCFHFGYHLEHHRCPQAPWWQLPSVYRRSARL